MAVDEFWHVETNFQPDIRVELRVSVDRESASSGGTDGSAEGILPGTFKAPSLSPSPRW